MLPIRLTTLDDWPILRALRIAALQDNPDAFGASLESTLSRTDQDWQAVTARRVSGERDAGFFAWDGGAAIGMAAGFIPADRPQTAILISMWIAPAYRRRGLARRLIDTVRDWALARGCTRLELGVTENNAPAYNLYYSYGFRDTGRREAHRPDRSLSVIILDMPIGGSLPA